MRLLRRLAVMAGCSCLLAMLGFLPEPAGATPVSVTLRWTAPGDDGMAGRAYAYSLRYSTAPITSANFAGAVIVSGLPQPRPPGSPETFTVTGLSPDRPYYFALKTSDETGNWSALSNVLLVSGLEIDLDEGRATLEFSTPWPNPAHAAVRFAYALPQPAELRVDVFDLAGRHLRELASGEWPAGSGEVEWDLRDGKGKRVTAGLYLVRARLAGETWTRRVMVVP